MRGEARGILAWFARNSVASNLLMLLILVGGFLSLLNLRQEVFPEFEVGQVVISTTYLGASPEEVENGVCKPIEEAIAGVEGIDRITSMAQEGVGTVIAELEEYADSREVTDRIEAEVNRIQTFPEQTEDPEITELTTRTRVLMLYLYGDVSEQAIKSLSDHVRDELMAVSGITQVVITGVRRPELAVELSEEKLRRYGLTFDEAASAIQRESRDIPGGSVRTPSGEVLIRTQQQRYTGRQFEDVVLHTQPDGTIIRLGDVAEVRDTFEETDTAAFFDGKPCATLSIFQVGDQNAIEIADKVKDYVKAKQAELPEGVMMATAADQSLFLAARIDLLTRNAMLGLILVFISLTLFLDLRLAFWTTLGIPISFMGAFWILPGMDVTVNMISLFAFIVVLGIVVDDAIVVGENIFTYRQQGLNPLAASIRGVREMAVPVTCAILTTVVAFLPLLFTTGQMGKIMRVIPMVVISVLLISLVEALLILPSHLAFKPLKGKPGPIARLQKWINNRLESFVRGPYALAVDWAVRKRYLTLSAALAMLILTLGYVAGGHLPFVFMEDMGADNVVADLEMPRGTPVEITRQAIRQIEEAGQRVRQAVDARRPNQGSIFDHVITVIGYQPFRTQIRNGMNAPDVGGASQAHVGEVIVELQRSEDRGNVSSRELANLWRQEVGDIPGASSLTFLSSYFSAGEAVNVELSHGNFDRLIEATDRFKQRLAAYAGVTDIRDSFEPGKLEAKVTNLTETGYALGVRIEDVGRQLRQGFYGAEAQRIQRDRDDVRVMVRYPESQRTSLGDLEDVRIRLPDGAEVPLPTVADVTIGRGYAQIDRADRRRVISVTADVDESIGNSTRLNAELADAVLPGLQQEFPGLAFRFAGQQREQTRSMQSLASNFMIAMLAIYGILGVQFRSYIQPVIVMTAIPFGLVGAAIGHVLLGFKLSFLSGFGVVALTGVVVNDSLIMIDLINTMRKENLPLRELLIQSGVRRFRPIMLTTLTTFCGLTPMLLETSLQARFLIPMAVSLAFGVLFSTIVTLILVPTLYAIVLDVRDLFIRPEPAAEPARSPIM